MKPVAIFRFSRSEGPGYLSEFLKQQEIPWTLVAIDEGMPVPGDVSAFSGVAMMGGPMSVNDPLPWIPPLLALIVEAKRQDIPMIGHCLGGQLMSKALGGQVTDNRCHELGWHDIRATSPQLAAEWLNGAPSFTTFQWHYQTFSIPPGATRLLSNDFCENQAFAMGKHIGFQCHIEMTAELVRTWCSQSAAEIRSLPPQPSVQTAEEILTDLETRVAALNRVAAGVYRHWALGLKA